MDTNPQEVTSPEDRIEQALLRQAGETPEPEDVEDKPEADDADPVDEPDTDEPEDEEPEEGQSEAKEEAEDLEDVELEGKTFRLPKEVKAAVLRQQDYTQKTQEVAERRRAVEDKEQYLAAREQLLSGAYKEAAKMEAIQTQLAQFNSIDWNTLVTEDAQQALRLNFARQQLQTQLAEQQRRVQEIVEQSKHAHTAHLQKQMELGRAELQRRLGKITDDDRKATWAQGLALGFSEQELASIPDPRLMHALHKAAKWDQLQAAKPEVKKKVAQAKPMQAPAARTTGQSQEQAKREEMRKTLRKTGRADVAEAYLARLFESKRKR